MLSFYPGVNTRISSCNAARLRKEVKMAAQTADNRCLKGNRRGNGNSQFINRIGICENLGSGYDAYVPTESFDAVYFIEEVSRSRPNPLALEAWRNRR